MPAASIRLILFVAAIGSAGCGARGVSLNVGAAQLRLNIRGPGGAPSQKAIVDCVTRASEMVVDYCDRFPVPELEINVVRLPFGGPMGGTHRGGRYIKVTVGPAASERVLRRDWVRIRELLHAAFPDLKRRHPWMQEGLSTFLETITRVNAGIWTGRDAWTYWTQMMLYGLPRPGDRGLDNTPSGGRVYWGGAIFWLLADVAIRERTDGDKMLKHAFLGILEAGGDGRADWSTQRVVQVGDVATGTSVLTGLYVHLAEGPGDPGLAALFERLGVSRTEAGLHLDDNAPDAGLRRALMARHGH